MNAYPQVPGFKECGGTSQAAAVAETHRAMLLREQVYVLLYRGGPMTADEAAAVMNESVLSIRPRFSELRKAGRIEATEKRRRNKSGRFAAVWMAVVAVRQRELWEQL